jgi:hypothetical protein
MEIELFDGEASPTENVNAESVGAKETDAITNKSSWLDGLDEKLKTDPTLRRFENVESLAKSYSELRKTVGKDVFPNGKTSEEELQSFWRKAGIPEKDKYNLDLNKFKLEKDVADKIKEIASTKGVTESGLSSIFEYLQEVDAKQNEVLVEDQKLKLQEQVDTIKKEFGTAFDKYRKLAVNVLKEYYSEAELQELNDEGILKNPQFVKMAMRLAKEKYNESPVDDKNVRTDFVMTPDEARAEINSIRADKDYLDKTSSRFQTLQKKMDNLYSFLNSL